MKLARHQIAAVLAKRSLASGLNEKRFSKEVAAYLLETGRAGELDSMARDVVSYRADHGIVEASATSVRPLSAAVRSDIRKIVKGRYPQAKQIIINEQIDPAAVGGVRLELIGRQLDLTVRSKLNHFIALTTTERTIL